MQLRKPPLPALTVKLSKYNVDDVALGVCKTGAEEAGVTEVRTSLSEKKLRMEQLTKNQAVATSQEAVQNQNEPQLRDENAHNDKSVHGVLNPTYQAGLRRDAVQPDIEAERKKRDEI